MKYKQEKYIARTIRLPRNQWGHLLMISAELDVSASEIVRNLITEFLSN